MAKVDKAPPAAALAELRAFLRIEDGVEDALLAGLVRAATETVEAMLGSLLLERDVEERACLQGGRIALAVAPAVRLISAAILAEDGSEVAVAPDAVRFGKTRFGDGEIGVSGVADGSLVVVRYRAGLADGWNAVPEILRLSVIRAAAHFHAHRDAADDGGLPPAVARMLAPWRTRKLC